MWGVAHGVPEIVILLDNRNLVSLVKGKGRDLILEGKGVSHVDYLAGKQRTLDRRNSQAHSRVCRAARMQHGCSRGRQEHLGQRRPSQDTRVVFTEHQQP